ncbi:MAG TPA: hypothetical protein VK465_15945 [Fibrobacteria bacterium]|nr:hypothetical protein [Fibrobacteria bacterium]
MLRGLLSMFLASRMFRMLGGRRGYGARGYRGYGSGWGTRHGGGYSGLSGLFGHMGRRRRGWI